MSDQHTPGPWELTQFLRPDGGPIETVEDVVDCLETSARRPGGGASLWGVTIPGTDTVVAYTGNGPTRVENARLIAASPDLLAVVRAVVAALPGRDKLAAVSGGFPGVTGLTVAIDLPTLLAAHDALTKATRG